MKKITTKDNSITYFNEEVKDYYHSQSGGEEEAREKYGSLLDKQGVIYDVCFGLGYNSAAALDKGNYTIYCFENDKEILKNILEIETEFKSWKIIQDFVKGFLKGNSVYEKDGNKLIMCFGDFRQEIKKIDEKTDFVFFDPFSPAKVPELWSMEVFKNIRNKMNSNGKLSTYSCAKFVRNNMEKVGLKVKDGPIIGRKSASTIAYL